MTRPRRSCWTISTARPLAEPRPLRFVTGKRKQFWNKNVVAIGLSGGFMEPLESTSIHLIQKAVSRLVAFFPDRGFSQADIDEFNRQSMVEFEQIRDFIILHYNATRRERFRVLELLPDHGNPRLLAAEDRPVRSNGRIFRNNNELFTEVSWFQVMFGQGIRPQGHHPLADAKSEDGGKMLADVKRVMHGVVELMPTHEDFIARNCKA